MKPPICEVCNARFAPSDGALVTCVSDEASTAWYQRQAEGRFVGHPPNKGWFCPDHRERAEALAPDLTLPQAVAAIRGEESESE